MELISDYMKDDVRRHMLNDLTQKTFGFDFEGWVTGGYFEGEYIPYSLMEDNRIISNVSANKMRFMQNGEMKYYIQLGTVMTDEEYRKQGLASKIIKHVIGEYEKECDGIYLFGNLDALGFYEKMGFKKLNQYRYHIKDAYLESINSDKTFKPVIDMDDDIKKAYLKLVRECAYNSRFEQINKYGLQMFYTAGFDNVYHAQDIDCFIVLDYEEGTILQSIICNKKLPLSDIIDRIDIDDKRLMLGFTPCEEDMNICDCEVYDGADDYRLFYMGKELETIERDKLYFPELSHA